MMFDMTLVAFWFYVIVLSHVSLSLLSGSGEAGDTDLSTSPVDLIMTSLT